MSAKGASAAAYAGGAERQQKQQTERQDEPFFPSFHGVGSFLLFGIYVYSVQEKSRKDQYGLDKNYGSNPLLRIKSAGGGVLCVWIGDLALRQILLGRRSLDKFLFVYVQLIKMGVRSISVLDNEGPVFWRK